MIWGTPKGKLALFQISLMSCHVMFSLEDNDVDDVISKFDAIITKYLEVEDVIPEHKSVLSLMKMDPSMIKFNQIVEVDLKQFMRRKYN